MGIRIFLPFKVLNDSRSVLYLLKDKFSGGVFMNKQNEFENVIPISQRFMLTPKEASVYFHICEKKIKALAAERPDASFIVYNGSHLLIIRKEFEKFLCQTSSI